MEESIVTSNNASKLLALRVISKHVDIWTLWTYAVHTMSIQTFDIIVMNDTVDKISLGRK